MNVKKHVAFGLLAALTLCGGVAVAETLTKTLISVNALHCKSCAQKIAGRLYTVRGVKEVRVSMEKKLFMITPQTSKLPSPRAMWEAVEKAESRPVRLVGPSGTFTKKPSS